MPFALAKNKAYLWFFSVLIILLPLGFEDSSFFPFWSAYFGLGIFYAFFITGIFGRTEYLMFTVFSSIIVLIEQSLTDLLIAWITLSLIELLPHFKSKIGEFFGKISYSLYLLHTIVGSAFINLMSHHFSTPYQKFFVISIGLILSIISAFVFWKFIELPSQKRAQKISIKQDD